jgi:G:T/U-mismatch repair DNA glycosylase
MCTPPANAIKAAEPNDLAGLVAQLPQLKVIAHNGAESAKSAKITQALGVGVVRLPSSSPANATWSFERKVAAWRAAFAQAGLVESLLIESKA